MKYEQPEVRLLGSAMDAVQNPTHKNVDQAEDSRTICSLLAYAADE